MTLFFLILFFALLVAVDFYVWSGLKSVFAGRFRSRLRILYWTANILMMALVSAALLMFAFRLGGFFFRVTVIALWVSLFVPKLIFTMVLLLEDTFRIPLNIFRRLRHDKSKADDQLLLVSRRKFVSQMGIVMAAVPFGFIVHGLTRGKYNFTIHRLEIPVNNLPDAFDGFTITQLSDLHAGSLDDRDEVARGLEMANEQQSDLLVFTGDLVNYRAGEMDSWAPLMSQLEARHGKISIVGNHDYGDYARWESEQAKEENFRELMDVHDQMGFNLLLNSNTAVTKNGASIRVVGVENWGTPPFQQRGDLDKALMGTNPEEVKILLSHDPMHWDRIVKEHQDKVDLTLAGHTHGFQFGVEIPGFRWSPVQYRYPQWAGLYSHHGRYVNVNRGFGFIGLPGRVGIWPEITVLTLKKA